MTGTDGRRADTGAGNVWDRPQDKSCGRQSASHGFPHVLRTHLDHRGQRAWSRRQCILWSIVAGGYHQRLFCSRLCSPISNGSALPAPGQMKGRSSTRALVNARALFRFISGPILVPSPKIGVTDEGLASTLPRLLSNEAGPFSSAHMPKRPGQKTSYPGSRVLSEHLWGAKHARGPSEKAVVLSRPRTAVAAGQARRSASPGAARHGQ